MNEKGLIIGNGSMGILLQCFILMVFSMAILDVIGANEGEKGEPIQVFLIPHSHTDPGWLKSVKGYEPEVFQILDNVVASLRDRNDRRFIWSDILYFREWFEIQNLETQTIVKELISNGRLEIVGGGWVQNDEACSSYTAIIDQMTLGHQYLLEKFGVRVRIGWQIDPFGHDSRVAKLFSDMGMDALVINRVHHRIKNQMKENKALEFIWKFEPTITNKSTDNQIFTHTLHTHYSAIFGFDFENSGVQAIRQNNIDKRSQIFVDEVKKRANHYRTKNILVPFGDDFKFKNAYIQFDNMDRLIDYINDKYKGSVHIKYATVSEYFDTLFEQSRRENIEFPVVKQDFIPYADNDDSYWTGYFSSLPNLKKRTRYVESALNAAENVVVFARLAENVLPHAQNQKWLNIMTTIQEARENVALVQHHDSITGTCRHQVYLDYMQRLSDTLFNINSVHKSMIIALLCSDESDNMHILNDVSDIVMEADKDYGVIVHNSNPHPRIKLVHIKSSSPYIIIKDTKGEIIQTQCVPALDIKDGTWVYKNDYDVYFKVSIPGFAIQMYRVSTGSTSEVLGKTSNVIYFQPIRFQDNNPEIQDPVKIETRSLDSVEKDIFIENEYYKISFDKHLGYIASILELQTNIEHAMSSQQFMEYKTKRSGSYIFRTDEEAKPLDEQELLYMHIIRGPLFEQAIIGTSRLTMSVRLPKAVDKDDVSSDYIQIVYDIHTLPSNSEMTTRFAINEANGPSELLVYDGKDIVKRYVHEKTPLPSHFYPMQAGAILVNKRTQLTVLTGHTMGVTKWNNELEIMMHRRLAKDDGRGMSEANNDEDSLSVSFLIKIQSDQPLDSKSIIKIHSVSHMINQALTLYATDEPNVFRTEFHAFNEALNPNLHILTLSVRDYVSEDIQLRIQNLSPTKDIRVNLQQLFKNSYLSITNIRRKSLNFVYDIPNDKESIHDQRRIVKAGKEIYFSFIDSSSNKGNGTNQNSEEEGVFLSDEAIANAKKEKQPGKRVSQVGRKILSVDIEDIESSSKIFTIPSNSIASFLVHIKLNQDAMINEFKLQNRNVAPILANNQEKVENGQENQGKGKEENEHVDQDQKNEKNNDNNEDLKRKKIEDEHKPEVNNKGNPNGATDKENKKLGDEGQHFDKINAEMKTKQPDDEAAKKNPTDKMPPEIAEAEAKLKEKEEKLISGTGSFRMVMLFLIAVFLFFAYKVRRRFTRAWKRTLRKMGKNSFVNNVPLLPFEMTASSKQH